MKYRFPKSMFRLRGRKRSTISSTFHISCQDISDTWYIPIKLRYWIPWAWKGHAIPAKVSTVIARVPCTYVVYLAGLSQKVSRAYLCCFALLYFNLFNKISFKLQVKSLSNLKPSLVPEVWGLLQFLNLKHCTNLLKNVANYVLKQLIS